MNAQAIKELSRTPILFIVSLYATLCAVLFALTLVDIARMSASGLISFANVLDFGCVDNGLGFTRSILLNVWSGVPLLLLSWLRYGERNLAFFALFAPLLCASVAPAWLYLGAAPASNYVVVLVSAVCYLAVLVETVVAMLRSANRHV